MQDNNLSFVDGLAALWGFYNEQNPRTEKFHWQHMEINRMTEIMVQIAESTKIGEATRAKVLDWLAEYGTI